MTQTHWNKSIFILTTNHIDKVEIGVKDRLKPYDLAELMLKLISQYSLSMSQKLLQLILIRLKKQLIYTMAVLGKWLDFVKLCKSL